MSRLEEIKQHQWDGYTIWDMSEDDLIWLIKQSERVQELEDEVEFLSHSFGIETERVQELEQKNDRLKQEADFWRVEDREMVRLSHENKRYREVIENMKKKISKQLEGLDAEEEMQRVVELSELMSMTIKALEGEE